MEFIWGKNSNRYSSGEDLSVGKVIVGGWFYDACSSKDEVNRYRINTTLPSYVPKITRFATSEEAKAALEAFTERWFKVLTATPTQNKGE